MTLMADNPDLNPTSEGPLRFRGGPLSNFAVCNLILPGPEGTTTLRYLTVEHRFQAMKAVDRTGHEWVRGASTAREAKKRGRAVRLRGDWEDVKVDVMREALHAKLEQWPRLRTALIDSGTREIIEDAPWDPVWGSGPDGNGQNLLGKLLMELRDTLPRPVVVTPIRSGDRVLVEGTVGVVDDSDPEEALLTVWISGQRVHTNVRNTRRAT